MFHHPHIVQDNHKRDHFLFPVYLEGVGIQFRGSAPLTSVNVKMSVLWDSICHREKVAVQDDGFEVDGGLKNGS